MKIRVKQFSNVHADAARRYPNDEHARLNHILANIPFEADIGRPRFVSNKRMTEIGNTLHLCLRELKEMRLPVGCLSEAKRKSLLKLIGRWQKNGLTAGTIEDRISILRKFLRLCGRPDVLPSGREWAEIRRNAGLSVKARTDELQMKKGWIDQGVDPVPIIEAVRADSAVAASCMEMMWAFGLRLNEAIQIQLAISVKDGYLLVTRGTKGGKTREVPFSENEERRRWQMEILARARVFCDQHPASTLSVAGLKLDQMKNRMRYLARKHGLTKKGKYGVTFHGLRHQFATTEFQLRTGLPAPIVEQLAAETYADHWEVVRTVYLDIARMMGHERPSITAAYVGRVTKLQRQQEQCLRSWENQLQPAVEAFEDAGVQDAFIIGPCAKGVPPLDGQALHIAARMRLDGGLAQCFERLEILASTLSQKVGLEVVVSPWPGLKHPGGYEVFLHEPARHIGCS